MDSDRATDNKYRVLLVSLVTTIVLVALIIVMLTSSKCQPNETLATIQPVKLFSEDHTQLVVLGAYLVYEPMVSEDKQADERLYLPIGLDRVDSRPITDSESEVVLNSECAALKLVNSVKSGIQLVDDNSLNVIYPNADKYSCSLDGLAKDIKAPTGYHYKCDVSREYACYILSKTKRKLFTLVIDHIEIELNRPQNSKSDNFLTPASVCTVA